MASTACTDPARPRVSSQARSETGTIFYEVTRVGGFWYYKLSNPDTLVITGQLGPGTWNRVWALATKSSQQPPGAGTCGLLTEGEAGDVLRAPVSGALDHRGSGDCIYKSLLSSFDKVSIKAFTARRQAWYITRKTPNPNFVDVPGVGEDAYIEHVNTGAPVVNILKGVQSSVSGCT